ncbi:MAG: hypothetical protein ABI818_20905 [Acidobacteriota bacterium]
MLPITSAAAIQNPIARGGGAGTVIASTGAGWYSRNRHATRAAPEL